MRRRLVAVFALLTAVLASMLTAASPAHAAGFDPVCSLLGASQTEFQCVVPIDPENRVVDTVRWTKNGVDRPDDNDFMQIRPICSPGEAVTIGLTVNFKVVDPATGQPSPAGQATGSTLFLCAPAPPRIGSLGCGAFPSLGWWRFKCSAYWSGGDGPVVLAWRSYYNPIPEITDQAGKYASALGICPGGYGGTSTVALTITDGAGRQDSRTALTGCP